MLIESFTTPRLTAERLLPSHLPELIRMDSDPVVMATMGGVRDEVRTRDYLERNLQHWQAYGYGVWIVREAATGRLAGRACVRHLELDGQDEIEIGYSLHPEFWGKGYATEIARECVRLGHETLGWPSLVAITLPVNRGSRHVLEKAGFVREREIVHAGDPHLLFRRTLSARSSPDDSR